MEFSISPELSVRRGREAIDFYIAAFGAHQIYGRLAAGEWAAGAASGSGRARREHVNGRGAAASRQGFAGR